MMKMPLNSLLAIFTLVLAILVGLCGCATLNDWKNSDPPSETDHWGPGYAN
jgi:hypothetical protein